MKKKREMLRTDEANRLVEARLRRGFSDARSAATFFGWNYDTYIQHERGERGLRKDVAAKYATAFRVSTAWLLTGEGAAGRPAAASAESKGTGNMAEPELTLSPRVLREAMELALTHVGADDLVAREVAALVTGLLAEPPLSSLSGDPVRSLRVRFELEAPRFERPVRP